MSTPSTPPSSHTPTASATPAATLRPAASPAASRSPEPLQPVAGVLGLLLPGLGHFYLGHIRRGGLIFTGVMGLFASGLLIGGIDSVDRREDFIWFLGQGLVGPTAFAVDYTHQHHFKVADARKVMVDPSTGRTVPLLRSAGPDEFRNPESGQAVPIVMGSDGVGSATYTDRAGRSVTVRPAYPPNAKGLGRMNELGTLFTTLAGFLNLICVLDALWHHRAERRGPGRGRVGGSVGGVGAGSVRRTLKSPGGFS